MTKAETKGHREESLKLLAAIPAAPLSSAFLARSSSHAMKLAVVAACLAVLCAFAAADLTVNIPGVVTPDVGSALNAAASSGRIAGARQAGGAKAPSAAGQQAGGQQAGGQQGQGQGSIAAQLQQAGVGGRHLLQAPACLFTGQVGGTGVFVSNFDLCPFTPGAGASSQCCAKGKTFFGKCIPNSLSCICGI